MMEFSLHLAITNEGGHAGMDWNEWNDWNGMDWNGMDWNGLLAWPKKNQSPCLIGHSFRDLRGLGLRV